MRQLIEHAQAGAFVFSSKVFDGTGPEALNTITAVIGRSEASSETKPAYGGTTWARQPRLLQGGGGGRPAELRDLPST